MRSDVPNIFMTSVFMMKPLLNNIFLYTLKTSHFVFIFNLFNINWFSSFAMRASVLTQPSSISSYHNHSLLLNKRKGTCHSFGV